MRDCTAVILAGGLGTRLRPLVSDKPKVLADVNGRPFLSYVLDQLQAAGIEHVIICTGYLGNLIQNYYGVSYQSLKLSYSDEMQPMGTAGALRLALPQIETGWVLAMNGDSYCDASLKDFYATGTQKNADFAMLLAQVPDAKRFGRVELTSDDKVLRYLEKDPNSGEGLINAGIYLLKKKLIETIPAHRPVSLEKEMFVQWLSKDIYGYRSEARFLDIGTVESYNEAGIFFKLNQGKV